MNGLITVRESGLKDRILKNIKKDELSLNGKTVGIYKLPNINKKIAKKLIKKLKKDNIKKVAFEKGIDEETTKLFENNFYIIKKEEVLEENIDKIILKAARLLGIKKGKLRLGIYADCEEYQLLNSVKGLKDRLKCIFIYTDDIEKTIISADEFYDVTGVPVVVKENMSENQIDILIIKGVLKNPLPDSVKIAVNLGKAPVKDERCIEDIRATLPPLLSSFNISHSVICSVFSSEFSINSFKTSEH